MEIPPLTGPIVSGGGSSLFAGLVNPTTRDPVSQAILDHLSRGNAQQSLQTLPSGIPASVQQSAQNLLQIIQPSQVVVGGGSSLFAGLVLPRQTIPEPGPPVTIDHLPKNVVSDPARVPSGLTVHTPTTSRYEIFGFIINVVNNLVTVQGPSRQQYTCNLIRSMPAEPGDIFYGIAAPPVEVGNQKIYHLLTDPMITMNYTSEVVLNVFRIALGREFGGRIYQALLHNQGNPRALSDMLDSICMKRRHGKLLNMSSKNTRRLLATWRDRRGMRQLELWGLSRKQIYVFAHLTQASIAAMLKWCRDSPEVFFVCSDEQISSIHERQSTSGSAEYSLMREAIAAMNDELRYGKLSVSTAYPAIAGLGKVLQMIFQKSFPVKVLDDRWYLAYPGTVVGTVRAYLTELVRRSDQPIPPYIARTVELGGSSLDTLQKKRTIQLHPDQTGAINAAIRQWLTVIPGAAGTGKTTILRAIRNWVRDSGRRAIIGSHTGKAVARIREVLGERAPLTFDMLTQSCDEGSQDADFLIVDEVSMMSIELLYRTLKVFQKPPQIILLGDPNQLPPVSWGPLLDSILVSGVRVNYLTEIHRYKDEMLINPHRIIKGLPLVANSATELYHLPREAQAIAKVMEIVQTVLSQPEWTYMDITIVTPYKYARRKLNAAISRMIFGNEKSFNIGDRVMLTENLYNVSGVPSGIPTEIPAGGAVQADLIDSVFNGEEGIVTEVNEKQIKVKFTEIQLAFDRVAGSEEDEDRGDSDEPRRYDVQMTTRIIQRSYGVTVHKSQGSEYPIGILFAPSSEANKTFLDRRLVYTAVTRAQYAIYVIGNLDQINDAIEREVVVHTEKLL